MRIVNIWSVALLTDKKDSDKTASREDAVVREFRLKLMEAAHSLANELTIKHGFNVSSETY